MTTASQTAPPARSPEDICPSWCAGHLERYQGWETLINAQTIREHAESIGITVGGATVMLCQTEDFKKGMTQPHVQLWAQPTATPPPA